MSFRLKVGRKKVKHNLIPPNKICVNKSSLKGRGVFAKEDLYNGEIVEECHFIICGCPQDMKDDELRRYAFTITFKKDASPEANEEISVKALLAMSLEDEKMQEEILEDLVDLGYGDISQIFQTATVLGNGMIYNHASDNNINWEFNYENLTFEFSANKDIQAGEELFINYGENYWKENNERIIT